MKKRLLKLLLSLIILYGLKLQAQRLNYGLEAGFDVANSHVTGLPSGRMYYPMISYNINCYLGYKINGILRVLIEPGFIQKGGLEKGTPDFRVQNNYIQMPLLVDYFINDKLYLSLGPEFAYLINAKAKSSNQTNDITKYYDRRNELSGLIGINYNIYKWFDIGLRYNHGLTYYSKIDLVNENGDKVGNVKEYNQYFQLILRIKK
jgi:hypothetical protein